MKHLYHGAAAVALLLAVPSAGHAQPVQTPTPAEAQAALASTPAPLTKAQLDQMLAPIALYPDQLLTELLMAATFPQQVIDAGKWLQDSSNAALKGDDLVAALQPLPWDPSVKSLVAFAQIIAMMNDHFDWTEALGIAFANQQVETLARVQFLRDRAVTAGQLKSNKQIAVRQEASDVVIEPADPAMVYVPVYNPAIVYGDWPDSDAPPVYLPPPPRFYRGEVGPEIGYSVGVGVVAPLWGWGHPDWRHHDIAVDPRRYDSITTTTNNASNHVETRNDTWHRTAPVATVPTAARPQPAAASAARQPPGTVPPTAASAPATASAPAAVTAPAPASAPANAASPAAVARPSPPPSPAETAHPAAAPQPGAASPKPAEAAHPAEATHPGETPHPAEAAHPVQALHPAESPQSGAASPKPAEATHPAEAQHPVAPPHPAEAAHPGEPPHPAETPHPIAPPHPAEAPQPVAPPHPAEVHPAPQPVAPPHPAEVHPAPQPHPEEHPAAPHSPAPPPPPAAHAPAPPPPGAHPPAHEPGKKPPPKPGEEDKPEQH